MIAGASLVSERRNATRCPSSVLNPNLHFRCVVIDGARAPVCAGAADDRPSQSDTEAFSDSSPSRYARRNDVKVKRLTPRRYAPVRSRIQAAAFFFAVIRFADLAQPRLISALGLLQAEDHRDVDDELTPAQRRG